MDMKKALLNQVVGNGKVITCEESQSLKEVVDVMNSEYIGAICVVKDQKLTGIFTERDFLQKVGSQSDQGVWAKPIKDFMTEEPVTGNENSNVYEVMIQMRLGNFRHLVLVNDDHIPVRMISIRDAFQYFLDGMEDQLQAFPCATVNPNKRSCVSPVEKDTIGKKYSFLSK